MKVLIFGGFLGAGKTTVIMQMAKYMVAMDPDAISKIVLLENEIGENGVDDKTLAETGMKVETLFSGCICCTMAGEMIENMRFIEKKFNPEWVILETTGMAYPSNVKKIVVDTFPKMEVHLISLVDAKRWNRMQRIPELKDYTISKLQELLPISNNTIQVAFDNKELTYKSTRQQIRDWVKTQKGEQPNKVVENSQSDELLVDDCYNVSITMPVDVYEFCKKQVLIHKKYASLEDYLLALIKKEM